tara:strand:- start:164 stop:1336 length:1173 start_codon:yes stop_codon:yes gene_type:complete
MRWFILLVAGALIGCLTVYFVHRYDLQEKYNALSSLMSLTTIEVDEYLDTFDTQWGENAHGMEVIKDHVSTPKDYREKKPVKPTDAEGINTAIVYKILNMMCSLGNVKKMYIPPAIDPNASLKQNQLLLEAQIADMIEVGEKDKVLDIGCGMGLIADHVADITGAEVHGFNVEPSGIAHAKSIALSKGRAESLFKTWDYNNYPWPYEDDTFDAIYEIQAFTFIREPERFFKELHRILKPGGRVVIDETVLMDEFDADNEEHWRLILECRPCGVGGNFWYYKYWEDQIKGAGFKLTRSERNKPALPLIKQEDNYFETVEKICTMANSIKLIPDHICRLLKRFRTGGDALIRVEEVAGYEHNYTFTMEKVPIKKPIVERKSSDLDECEESAA